jgi:hypothetical protein
MRDRKTLWAVIAIGSLVGAFLFAGFMLKPPFRLYPDPGPHFPAEGWVTVEQFSFCPEGRNCTPPGTMSETRIFGVTRKVPGPCCLLLVLSNNRGDKHRVEAFHIALNGQQVNLRSSVANAIQIADVTLGTENKLTVQLTGTADAFLWVGIHYGAKNNDKIPGGFPPVY